nr:hypothetical protein [Tanacetum cinerariifolium]
MATTIKQQTALDESLVPSSQRLRIGRCNFRLPSDIQSKEATLQVVYDVLRNSPLFRAFQVTTDVPEIYMQEFCSTAKLHHTSIRFKIDTKKSVLNLEAFREMLHISPRIPNQPFADLPTEEEVLDFLKFLGHSQDIRYLTDVNVNKLYQPWRSFTSVINKCLTGKSSGVDSFRLATTPVEQTDLQRTEAEQLKIVLKRSRRETHISQQSGYGTEEETAKDDEENKETGIGGDEVRESGGESEEEKETSEQEEVSFDPIPRIPKDSEKESDDEEEQESRLREEARIQEEEDA